MAAFFLPCKTDLTDFTFQTDLDGSTYSFRFRWNERLSAWFMDLSDVAGVALASGVRVVVGFPLVVRSRYNTAMPPGSLWASDTSSQDIDPGISDLGNRVQILYYSIAADGA